MSALTNVLIKVFVKGFYRAHSGMFLFFFVAIITYCFFIEVLNKTHLPTADITPNHLIIVLTIITSPVVLIFVGVMWLAYTIKTYQYIKAELWSLSNQFLRYSSTSIPKINQFGSWLTAQLLLSIPMILYSCFAFIVGLVYEHYWFPIALIIYIVFVAIIAAAIHTAQINALGFEKSSRSSLVITWRKPFWSLYLFQIVNEQRTGYGITKLLSWCIIVAGSYLLLSQGADLIAGGIITLAIVVTHSFLIYDSFRFEKAFLNFSRNLPYSKTKIYLSWTFCYLLLTLPESIWLFYKFEWKWGAILFVFNLATGIFYRNLLYKISLNTHSFLRIVFFSFVFFFLVLVMKLIIPIIAVNLTLSMLLFSRYFYHQKNVAND